MEDRDRVAAICAHDPRGLASTYEVYASALYTFCRSMLRDEHAAQDAVHDTFVILDARVGQLRDPNRLRPWLYAIARSQCLRHLRSTARSTPTDDLGDVMDESGDVATDMESTDLQALVWDAMGGLNSGERAALEMSLRHGLAGADLADALGVSQANAKKLIQRGKDELERSIAVLVLARAPENCSALNELTIGWDGSLTPLMRKRVSRHIERCDTCGEHKRRKVNAFALLATIPFLAVPVELTKRVQSLGLVSHEVAFDEATSTQHGDRVRLTDRERRLIARSAGPFDRDGFPTTRRGGPRGIGVIFGAAAVAAMTALLISSIDANQSSPGDVIAIATQSGPSGATPAKTSSTPSTPSSSTGPSGSIRPSTRLPTYLPQVGPVSISAATTPSPTKSHSTTPTTSVSTKPSQPPTPGTLELSTPKLNLGANSSGRVQVLVKGSPVTWTATAGPGIVVKPSGSTTTTSAFVTIEIDRSIYPKAGSSAIEFSWATGKTQLTVTWADAA